MASGSTWTQRQLLMFPDIKPGLHYSLPFFAHNSLGSILFTTQDGKQVPLCEDLVYQAADHRLLWLDSRCLKNEKDQNDPGNMMYFYFGGITNYHLADTCESPCVVQQLGSPADVMLFSDTFHTSSLGQWLVAETLRSCVSVRKRPGDCNTLPMGGALRLKPPENVPVIVCHEVHVDSLSTRLHFRAHFYDVSPGALDHHWVSLRTSIGFGSLGVSPEAAGFYALSCSEVGGNWQHTVVQRTVGWHLFELVIEQGKCVYLVDGEPVKSVRLGHFQNTVGHIEIGACGSNGFWGGVELLHTPEGEGTWELGVQEVKPTSRRPWRIRDQYEGKWTISSNGEVESILEDDQVFQEILQNTQDDVQQNCTSDEEIPAVVDQQPPMPLQVDHAPLEVNPNTEVLQFETAIIQESIDPVATQSRPKSRMKPRRVRRPPSPLPLPALMIECWSLPVPEDGLARMDRVMGVFLDKLRESGVVLPENITRLERCLETQHADCYIYSFGTRRLHVAIRDGEGGRLALVVRCGGGFLDFAEFARRHGSIEHLKLRRRPVTSCNETINLVSVLTHGGVQLKERVAFH